MIPPSRPASLPNAALEGLTYEERAAVHIGRDDAVRFGFGAVPPRSNMFRVLRALARWLTGWSSLLPLSSERLEDLRLLACLARLGDSRVEEVAARLVTKGMPLEVVNKAMARARPDGRRREGRRRRVWEARKDHRF